MQVFDHIATLKELCRLAGKPGIYVRLPQGQGPDETEKAIPWLDLNGGMVQAYVDETFYVLCDDQAECDRLYEQVVGDDGPTETNPYNGPARVYALTCDAEGQTQRENT